MVIEDEETEETLLLLRIQKVKNMDPEQNIIRTNIQIKIKINQIVNITIWFDLPIPWKYQKNTKFLYLTTSLLSTNKTLCNYTHYMAELLKNSRQKILQITWFQKN